MRGKRQSGIDVIGFKGISLERTPEATEAEEAINNSARKLHFKTMRLSLPFPSQQKPLSKNFLQKLLLSNTLIHLYLVKQCNPPHAEGCPLKGRESRINLASGVIEVSDTTQCSQAGPQLVELSQVV